MAATGITFLLAVNTGTLASPVYTNVGGQQNASLNLNLANTETTSKDSNDWEEHLPTIRSWSIDADALILETDSGFLEIEDWYLNRTQLQVRITTAAARTYTGMVSVESISHDMPMDATTFSVSLKGTGALTVA